MVQPAVFYLLSIVITLQKSMSCHAACKKSIPIKVFLSFVETIASTKQSIVTIEDPCNYVNLVSLLNYWGPGLMFKPLGPSVSTVE